MQRVAVVDYGMGNLRSVAQALQLAAQDRAVEVVVTQHPQEVLDAHRVVLPGQGAMRDCMAQLRNTGLQEAVVRCAAHKPLLGICVGMQMLLEHSQEQDTPGLGLMPGRVLKFELGGRLQPDGSRFKVPHMGWNRVVPTDVSHPLWQGTGHHPWFYFVHSYFAQPSDPRHTAAVSEYGESFTCALAQDNIFATQFHPEKSAAQGVRLYQNFLDWRP